MWAYWLQAMNTKALTMPTQMGNCPHKSAFLWAFTSVCLVFGTKPILMTAHILWAIPHKKITMWASSKPWYSMDIAIYAHIPHKKYNTK